MGWCAGLGGMEAYSVSIVQGSPYFLVSGGAARLADRRAECAALDRLIEAVRAGESRALVVRGEPGAGKSALLDYLAGQAASGCQVVRAVGVQSEMELAFAGLHQLCAPLLDRLDGLPAPQREALRTAFGLSAGPPPDRFLVGLAVLSLLAEVAEERPLLCLIDDAQWLDRASAQVLGVRGAAAAGRVGRRWSSRAREPGRASWPGCRSWVDGLRDADARALLGSALPGPLDARVRDRIVAETRRQPAGAAGAAARPDRGASWPAGSACPDAATAAGPDRGRASGAGSTRCRRRPGGCCCSRPPSRSGTRRWCGGRPSARDRAPRRRAPAAEAGLLELGARVRFRHPLVRSAVYRAAAAADRRRVAPGAGRGHRPGARPRPAGLAPGRGRGRAGRGGRRGARAVRRPGAGPRRAGRGRGVPASARSALTADPARRAERALAAAQASLQAGAFDKALGLLAIGGGRAAGRAPARPGSTCCAGRSRSPPAWAAMRRRCCSKAASRLEPLDLGPGPRDLPGRLGRGAVRRAPGGAGDLLEVCRGRPGLPRAGAPAAPGRPAARRPGRCWSPTGRAAARAGAAAGDERPSPARTSPQPTALRWGWLATGGALRAVGRRRLATR